MANKQRFYVVWNGHNPGVYDNWEDAKLQVDNYPNARYKAFSSAAEAAEAYREGAVSDDSNDLSTLLTRASGMNAPQAGHSLPPEVDPDAWTVDASCLGNPGKMEYQGVRLSDGKTLFRVGPFLDATNNIGEFLAIVHAMASMDRTGEWHTIYSDSRTAISWVRKGVANTKLSATTRNAKVFELIRRAEHWLSVHNPRCRVLKWDTPHWGEIPADFGRK